MANSSIDIEIVIKIINAFWPIFTGIMVTMASMLVVAFARAWIATPLRM